MIRFLETNLCDMKENVGYNPEPSIIPWLTQFVASIPTARNISFSEYFELWLQFPRIKSIVVFYGKWNLNMKNNSNYEM